MAFLTPFAPRTRDHRFWSNARSRFSRALFAIIFAFRAVSSPCAAEAPRASEQEVKAAFLLNFQKYMDWPANAFPKTNSPFVIAVLGDSQVIQTLEFLSAGRTFNGRSVTVSQVSDSGATGAFHILFVPAAAQGRAGAIMGGLKPGVLTVGEADDFLANGGVINLALRQEKVALEINPVAASRAEIKISSKLLSLATLWKAKGK